MFITKAIRGIISAAALLALTAVAQAGSSFTFVPASNYSCVSYCTGYFASDPADTIGYINLQYAAPGYKLTLSLNGKVYQGSVPTVFEGGTLYSADGSYVTMTDVNYTLKHTCVRSGRGQTCHSWYFVTDGTITQ